MNLLSVQLVQKTNATIGQKIRTVKKSKQEVLLIFTAAEQTTVTAKAEALQ
jgi:hypothetical protein